MIASRKVKSLVALHAVPADKNVLERSGKRVAAVKLTGNVGRRDRYCETTFLFGKFTAMLNVVFGLVEAFFIPPAVPRRFNDLWDICLGEGAVVQRLEYFLLAFLGLLDVFPELLVVGLLLSLLLLFAGGLAGDLGAACCSLCGLFRLEFSIFFSLFPLLFQLLLGFYLLLYVDRRILGCRIGVGGIVKRGLCVVLDGRR